MAAYSLSAQQVERALIQENVESPGGRLIRGDNEFGVRTMGRITAAGEFNNIIVANIRGAPVRMRDIGTVEDGFGELRTYAAINGKEAVLLEVHSVLAFKRRELDTTETLDMAMARPAKTGDNSQPSSGYNAPAASGMPMTNATTMPGKTACEMASPISDQPLSTR